MKDSLTAKGATFGGASGRIAANLAVIVVAILPGRLKRQGPDGRQASQVETVPNRMFLGSMAMRPAAMRTAYRAAAVATAATRPACGVLILLALLFIVVAEDWKTPRERKAEKERYSRAANCVPDAPACASQIIERRITQE